MATLVLGLRRSIEKALYHAITDLAASRKLKEDLVIIFVFIVSELASVKAHDREVTQQAKYAQEEVNEFKNSFCIILSMKIGKLRL